MKKKVFISHCPAKTWFVFDEDGNTLEYGFLTKLEAMHFIWIHELYEV